MSSAGSKYLRYLQRRKIRASVESGLDAATTVPNSGFTFVENSQGASAAAAELSRSLDTAIEQIDLEGDLTEQLRVQLGRLNEEATEYSNSSLAGLTPQTEWSCSQTEAEVISIAWKCAASVYSPTSDIRPDGFNFKRLNYIPSSIDGATKATAFTLVDEASSRQLSNPFLPLLVVAVRGTASTIDHMVNLNSQAKNASYLFDTEYLDHGIANPEQTIEAHSGFLNSAQALKEAVSKCIDISTKQGYVKNVLFTGHSAGGAVASLLYLRYLFCGTSKYPLLRFSCITFGSPPVLRPEWPPRHCLVANDSLVLNIINEYDLVTRIDHPYIRTLVDLYRSIYRLPPIQEVDSRVTGTTLESQTSSAKDINDQGEVRGNQARKYWIVPKPEYYHVGKRVVLKLSFVRGQYGDPESNDGRKGHLVLNASCIPAEEFAKLLFCRVAVHSRVCYEERVRLISEGCFNGRNGWFRELGMSSVTIQESEGSGTGVAL